MKLVETVDFDNSIKLNTEAFRVIIPEHTISKEHPQQTKLHKQLHHHWQSLGAICTVFMTLIKQIKSNKLSKDRHDRWNPISLGR